MAKKRIELNKDVFLVDRKLMQETFNLLQELQFSKCHGIISQLLDLKSFPVKDFSTYEVPVEAPKEEQKVEEDLVPTPQA